MEVLICVYLSLYLIHCGSDSCVVCAKGNCVLVNSCLLHKHFGEVKDNTGVYVIHAFSWFRKRKYLLTCFGTKMSSRFLSSILHFLMCTNCMSHFYSKFIQQIIHSLPSVRVLLEYISKWVQHVVIQKFTVIVTHSSKILSSG